MASIRFTEWQKLPVCLSELCIDTTLRCGQSFRWKKLGEDEWSCALHGRILSLKQDSTHLHYRVIWPKAGSASLPSKSAIIEDDTESLIRNYFNLTQNLADLYEMWSLADPNFKKRAPKFTGVRILKQDGWEALVGFICSSNNNIARISQMVNNLCIHYGSFIGHVGDQAFHDFPSPEALTGPEVEAHLRELGFGYRARYLAQTAVKIVREKPVGWLDSLRNCSDMNGDLEELPEGGRNGYRKAHEELLGLQGVGPKVADCVCLMGLGWGEAVPVDTHVWQIAQRDYKFSKGKHKSLTKATYDDVAGHFRKLWGRDAGWAHSVLFAADLKTFAIRLTATTKMDFDETVIKEEETAKLQGIVTSKRQLTVEEIVKEWDEKSVLQSSKRPQRSKRIKSK